MRGNGHDFARPGLTDLIEPEQAEAAAEVLGQAAGEQAVSTLLRLIGEDPERDGLQRTPARVVKAWREMTSGYQEDPHEILKTTFEVHYDQMVVLDSIPFVSLCEHHVLPFTGVARVGYVPSKDGHVVGISKLARLVECFARRLQVQERLTQQVANAVHEILKARGTGVVIRAAHECMSCRGVKKHASMVTSCLRGDMRTDGSMRAEFLALPNIGA